MLGTLRLLLQLSAEETVPPSSEAVESDGEYWPTATWPGLVVSGVFACVASLISFVQIYRHITNYEDPVIQRYYIRIIILIPNYALCSFFSLVYPGAALYIETVRDMYEAFVIYTFMSLLLQYIGGPASVEAYCRDTTLYGSYLYCTCCIPAMQVDGQFVKFCKRCVLQFVILKPILVILTIVLYSQGLYTEGDWSPDSSYLYLQVVYNFTYAAALLALIHFWAGTKDMLAPYKPLWKFITVKGVVFITFWQGLLLSLLLIERPSENAKQLQTWLLCIEMLPAAVAMWFAFPASQYMSAQRNRAQGGIMMAVQNVGNVVMFTDVVTDLKHQFKPQYNTYTCYKDLNNDEEGPAGQQPTGQYRHATYIIRDPFQEQAIATQQSQIPMEQAMAVGAEIAGEGGGPAPMPFDFVDDLDDVPLGDGASAGMLPPGAMPSSAPVYKNPFMTDLNASL